MKRITLSVSGPAQSGKSLLTDCLLGGNCQFSSQSNLEPPVSKKYTWGEIQETIVRTADGAIDFVSSLSDTVYKLSEDMLIENSLWLPFLEDIDIFDLLPYGQEDEYERKLETYLNTSDFIIVVIEKALNSTSDFQFLQKIQKMNKFYTIILNCQGKRHPQSKQTLSIGLEIYSKLSSQGLLNNYVAINDKYHVFPVNLFWAKTALKNPCNKEQLNDLLKIQHYLGDSYAGRFQLFKQSGFWEFKRSLQKILYAYSTYKPTLCMKTLNDIVGRWQYSLKHNLEKRYI